MTTTIPMRNVVSGNILRLGHHNGDLYVEFQGGSRYRYSGVPAKLYQGAFADGVSPGKWLHSEIKGKFKHEKIGGEGE